MSDQPVSLVKGRLHWLLIQLEIFANHLAIDVAVFFNDRFTLIRNGSRIFACQHYATLIFQQQWTFSHFSSHWLNSPYSSSMNTWWNFRFKINRRWVKCIDSSCTSSSKWTQKTIGWTTGKVLSSIQFFLLVYRKIINSLLRIELF